MALKKPFYGIMGVFGAPFILQSDNGKEFRNQIVTGLKKLWPDINIIQGHREVSKEPMVAYKTYGFNHAQYK
jgi:hypothetical protein